MLPRHLGGRQHNHGCLAARGAPAWLAHAKTPSACGSRAPAATARFWRAGAMLPRHLGGRQCATVDFLRHIGRAHNQGSLRAPRARAPAWLAHSKTPSACGRHAPAATARFWSAGATLPRRSPGLGFWRAGAMLPRRLPAFGVREPCSRGARQGASAQRLTSYGTSGVLTTRAACERPALAAPAWLAHSKTPSACGSHAPAATARFWSAGAVLPRCPAGRRPPARSAHRASHAGARQNPRGAMLPRRPAGRHRRPPVMEIGQRRAATLARGAPAWLAHAKTSFGVRAPRPSGATPCPARRPAMPCGCTCRF